MRCPYCGFADCKVIDSRSWSENRIRRRRECLQCGRRFNTVEAIETTPLQVVKKDGTRQPFDCRKILNGLLRACEKRPIPTARLEALAVGIERELHSSLESEVPSEKIGELVMDRLKTVDEVAYVRFASVYRQFTDIDSFQTALANLKAQRASDTEEWPAVSDETDDSISDD